MTYKTTILGLAAATALVITGCSKEETSTKAPTDSAAKRPEAVASEKAPAAPATASPAAVSAPAVPAPATTPTPVAAAPSVSDATVAATTTPPASSALSLAQNATNQLQSLLGAATNQALALGTNVAGLTNQFQVLLDRAKTLTTNGQYQAAIATVSQLYSNKLTPDQKLQVDKLQTQLQGALTRTATNGLAPLGSTVSNQVLSALGMTNQGVAPVTNQVGALIERAKTLTTNQQYQAALTTIDQLYATKLTPDQKLKVDDLKNQIQKSLADKAASEASSVIGNFLGGKK